MNNILQISQISLDEFMGMIDEKISQALEKISNSKNTDETKKDFYTRNETAKLLGVSYTTLFLWNNKGILTANKIGNRVYYSKNEVLSKLKISL